MTACGPAQAPPLPAVAAVFWGAPVTGRGAAQPSVIASPLQRPQSKQVSPPRPRSAALKVTHQRHPPRSRVASVGATTPLHSPFLVTPP
jgi:hypothetical protein